MDEEKRIKLRDVWQRISFIIKKESLRRALYKYWKADKMPDDAAAWCSIFVKEDLPDIEIYIDELAKAIANTLRERNMFTEELFHQFFTDALTISLLHEMIHYYGETTDEERVEAVTDVLIRDVYMTWHYIPCPKLGFNVTWMECLACKDKDKHPSCPLLKVRMDAAPRKYRKGKYHVSDLDAPRCSWFRRNVPFSRNWDNYFDLLFGKALGWFIESKYAEHQREVTLEVAGDKLPNGTPEDAAFSVVGHGDIIDEDVGWGIELKFYYNLSYMAKERKANPRHEFQIQAYYTLGKIAKPYMFDKIKALKVIYYSKLKSRSYPRRMEFDVPLKEVDLLTPARELWEADKTGVPPKRKPCEGEPWRKRWCQPEIQAECDKT